MRVGFVGLGNQGAAMAHSILGAGHDLSIWARREASLEPFRSTGATISRSLSELGAVAEVVGICVLTDADVEDVVVERGLLAGMRPGATLVIHSTVRPETCLRIAASAARRGVELLDAPVSGGEQKALDRELVVMVGGDPAVVERCRPVFESYANKIVRVGGVGAGQVCKIVNNATFVANVGVALEGLALGAAHGLERDALADIMLASSGTSMGLEAIKDAAGLAEASRFLEVLEKDAALATGIARAIDIEMPAAEAAMERALSELRRRPDSAQPDPADRTR